MKKDFIIIALGNVENIKDDLTLIATGTLNFAESDNAVFCTFPSVLSIQEIKDVLYIKKRGFFVFELKKGGYTASLGNQEVEDLLFKSILPTKLKRKSEPKSGPTTKDAIIISPKEIIKIEDMTKDAKLDMIDKIIDKGAGGLTKKDKELIKKLSK